MELKAARIKEFRLIIACIAAIVIMQLAAPYIAVAYQKSIFTSLQAVRYTFFHFLPFSLGDCLYIGVALLLMLRLIQWLRRPKKNGMLGLHLLAGVRRLLGLYLLLLLLWGILYEQPKLYRSMDLPELHDLTKEELLSFDSLLIARMNRLHATYQYPGLRQCNEKLSERYKQLRAGASCGAKPTLFSDMLAYLGVQGYFNPFTGEAQVNTGEPDFMMPFLIAHEMAHQTGVAAEDDANLAAYIACMESTQASLQYSACFNIWLYVHRKVRGIDSTVANHLKLQLNPRSLAQLDTLRARAEKYHTLLDDLSSLVFDAYLKIEQQESGINSYRNVAWSALAWEKQKNNIYLVH